MFQIILILATINKIYKIYKKKPEINSPQTGKGNVEYKLQKKVALDI